MALISNEVIEWERKAWGGIERIRHINFSYCKMMYNHLWYHVHIFDTIIFGNDICDEIPVIFP